jgi:hypothetical protein
MKSGEKASFDFWDENLRLSASPYYRKGLFSIIRSRKDAYIIVCDNKETVIIRQERARKGV